MERIIGTDRYIGDNKAQEVVEYLFENQTEINLQNSILYYSFPAIGDYEEEITRPFILVLSEQHGLVIVGNIFDAFITDERIEEEDDSVGHYYGLLEGMLKKSRILKKKRDLTIGINSIIYVSSPRELNVGEVDCDSLIAPNLASLKDCFDAFIGNSVSPKQHSEIRSILEGAKALGPKKSRAVAPGFEATKVSALAELEKEISNFDSRQRLAAITLLKGPQRIRGLAGSGKTVVLAMKVAQMHIDDPERTILFTFFTKSLYGLIRHYITRFCDHYNNQPPDWKKIHVLHAWGGRNVEGVYYNTCIDQGQQSITFSEAKRNNPAEPFGYICEKLLDQTTIIPKYDSIIIDEAQDFPQQFFKLCYHLAYGNSDEKNIIWAYDELQSIIDVKQKTSVDFFGRDDNGNSLIDLERASQYQNLPAYISNDTVLKKCYRTPLNVLLSAHALGFGLYDNIVQMLENERHWNDVGYEIVDGQCVQGSNISILRPLENSPLSIENYKGSGDLMSYYKADSVEDEIQWIVNEVKLFIDEGLKPHDIMVISVDDRHAKLYFEHISVGLVELGIKVNNVLSNPYTSTKFKVKGSVTLSTVYRAKGNEAPVIFVAGIDSLGGYAKSLRSARNRLFTAFTRTKAWLRLSGLGENAKQLFQEVDTALHNSPYLNFVYPDLKQIDIIQHDLSMKKQKINKLTDDYLKKLKSEGLSDADIFNLLQEQHKK